MARIELSEGTGSEVSRIWATAPGLGSSLQPVLATMYDSAKLQLSPRVREACRMRIAVENGCGVCQAHRLPGSNEVRVTEELYVHVLEPTHPEYSQQESLGIQYAGLFARNHRAIDDEFVGRLRELFTDSEIAELTMLLGVWLGLGRLTRTLDLDEACALEPLASH